jgi:hypothetical protein
MIIFCQKTCGVHKVDSPRLNRIIFICRSHTSVLNHGGKTCGMSYITIIDIDQYEDAACKSFENQQGVIT